MCLIMIHRLRHDVLYTDRIWHPPNRHVRKCFMNQSDLHGKVFLFFLLIVTLAFFSILLPFYGGIFWGFVLAILFMPLNDFFLRKMPAKKNLAALLTLAICLLIVIIPLIVVAGSLVEESSVLYQKILNQKIDSDASFHHFISQLPDWAVDVLNHFGISTFAELQKEATRLILVTGQYLGSRVFIIGQNVLDFTVGFFVMLYLLFFLVRDGHDLADKIRSKIPLADNQKTRLLTKFMGVIRATVKGNLVVALVQGGLGGLIFWFLGIEAALLWGAIMSVLSLLPAGSGVVWAPVAIYFLLTGSILKGVILLAFGILVIGLIDNFLRPLLVGKDTQMPDYLVLISTIGGMALFGLNGFIIGPMIAALFLTAWDLFSALTLFKPAQSPDSEKGKDNRDDSQ